MFRSICRGIALALPSLVLTALALGCSSAALSQSAGVTQISGIVLDAQRRPVGSADVRLSGPVSKATTTAGDGSFVFLNLPTGTFSLEVSKAGFNSTGQNDIATSPGTTTNISFTLQAASLTSLTIIGNVAVSSRNGANSINTTPASIVDVPASTFTDQGQLSVNQVLNQQPGLTVGVSLYGGPFTNAGNGASPLANGVPSIRGGLPYETESLIDGHAISLGELGSFSPSFISPYLLQNVEVVKGPGATSPSINYAVNGTVNYRTLEPTIKREESADFGMDQYGGTFANLRATGTLPGGRLSYAFDYATQGTQGFARGFNPAAVYEPGSYFTYLNGALIMPDQGFVGAPDLTPNIYGSFQFQDSFMICCPRVEMNSNQHNELGKIRYAFTPATTLTVTWLGGQTIGATQGACLFNWDGRMAFVPPAGYTGSFQAGATSVFPAGSPQGDLDRQETNLFETEFHTPIGKTATLLLRQYSSSFQTFAGGPGDSGPSAAPTTSFSAAVYGGVYYANATTPTIFNGQVATLTEQALYEYGETRTYNDLNGYTAEIDKQAGDDLLSLSYDQEKTSTYAEQEYCDLPDSVIVPGGSSQTFQSIMGRAQFELGARLNGTLSDNFGSYTDVYTQNDGATFQSATHTYEAPRLSLTWRPNANQAVRASMGISIAPPYIALLNNNEIVEPGTASPVQYFTESSNSGDVLPETAFGFDVGFDTRLRSPYTVLSVDAYQTLLHDQFLQETTEQGTYTETNPGSGCFGETAPLFVTKTANLGHFEYEGVELSLHRNPPFGWGYRIQGSLMRAFAYDIPAGFYNTPAGPLTTNLQILPNINFQGNNSYGALSSVPIPYSMGYGEINYRGRNGSSFLAGVTYYGPNNSYFVPAFEVVTVSFTQPLTRRTSLQLSIFNLTNALPNFYFNAVGSPGNGIYPTLANGQVDGIAANVIGPSTARLTLHVGL